jgi:hypothetical protein
MIRKKKKLAKTHNAIIKALNHQFSTQCYELSTTAHVVRKLLMAVVAFRTTILNHPSIITLFGCFRCLDYWIEDLLYLTHMHIKEKLSPFHETEIFMKFNFLVT